jgi:DNA-directed RNA polymerase subunit M/transcription elongation factor TFIIS
MAIINCPECGHKMSDKASECPNCGMPIEVINNILSRNLQTKETTHDDFVISSNDTNDNSDSNTSRIVSVDEDDEKNYTWIWVTLVMFLIIGSLIILGRFQNGNEKNETLSPVDSAKIKSLITNISPSDTTTSDSINITKKNVNYADVEIGDYFYSDGTYSKKRDNSKDCIGIVYSLYTSGTERQNGWDHGQIVAMKDASDNATMWSTNVQAEQTDIPNIRDFRCGNTGGNATTNFAQASGDKDGYDYSHSEYIIDRDFPPFAKAKSYYGLLPMNTSGWYLPSVGQWVDIMRNLGNVEFYLDEYGFVKFDKDSALKTLKELNLKDKTYFSSTEVDNVTFWAVEFEYNTLTGESKQSTWGFVRSVAAF